MLTHQSFGIVAVLWLVGAASAASAQQPPASGAFGRVVATVTTLDGTVHMPGVQIDLMAESETTVIATTTTDGRGMVEFPDVPPGRYVIKATRTGFISASSTPFNVRPDAAARVLLDIKLTFVVPQIEVRAGLPSPTNSVQPVSMSDMLDGHVLDVAPLLGDDFHNLMLLLPGIVRGPDGRLRVKGGQPTQSALQVSSASLNDPSTGDFDLDLPGQSVESVEVLANPFAAEYGRFSSSVTQIHTRRGTNTWEMGPGNLFPRLRSLTRVRGFEPRFSIRGPLKENRVFFAEDLQFRYVATPIKSLPGQPDTTLKSFDSFTRVDAVTSAKHTVGGGLILFPRKITGATMNTFRPPEVTPDFTQSGTSAGLVDRYAIAPDVVLETTVSDRRFEVNVNTTGRTPMVYAPQTQSGSFFNDQERAVTSDQWVEALSFSHKLGKGEHVFKTGTDLQMSKYNGFSLGRPIEVRRLDGSLAERTVFGPRSMQDVSGTDFAVFAQDRWRVDSRLTIELGFRIDRDPIVEHVNYSPRAGASVSVLPGGRGILRGGFGKFVQATPLNVGAFASFEPFVVSRFLPNGSPLGAPIAFRNVVDELHTPEAGVGNVEWDQRFGRRTLVKLAFLRRHGSHEHILQPDPLRGEVHLQSAGTSNYRELEATTRYLGGERRDITVSYVWARGEADLNNYDQFFGNLRNPILRANEHNLIPTDVRHRLLVRGTIGLPGQWLFAPVVELRSGFPWSTVNEFQDFVGPRNRAGRLPPVRTLDFSLARPFRFRKYRFRLGVKMYNALGATAERDVQNNVTSPLYGTFYNPIERSIGFVVGTAK